jgi:hypothetical protein
MAKALPCIWVYSDEFRSKRLHYILEFIFGDVLDATYFLAPLEQISAKSKGVLYHSSEYLGQNAINIWNSKQIDQRFNPDSLERVQNDQDYTFTKDILAEIFFHLSRMEEYNGNKDALGRFPAKNSYLFQKQLLEIPIVDRWIEKLRLQLMKQGVSLKYTRSFSFIQSYDIDLPWLVKNRGIAHNMRSLLGNALRGQFSILSDRIQILLGLKNDPYDTWDDIINLHENSGVPAKFFLLLTDRKGIDPFVPFRHPKYKQLIHRLKKIGTLGLHGGGETDLNENALNKQIQRYIGVTGEQPKSNRQHYLRITLPQTYKLLIKQGIMEDWSMGYADNPGFRAGTSYPFYWYDLEKEEKTKLRIHPLIFMDVSFKKYLKLNPEESFQKMINIEREVRQHQGQLTSLWHNSSFYNKEGWKNWWICYSRFLKRHQSHGN